MRHRSGRPPREGRRESGVALVELAFVAVILMTLAGGGYDFGMAWRSGLAVNEAARTGARTGSALKNDRGADFIALTGARAALDASGELERVQRVVIYRSGSADGKVPNACKTGNGSGCHIISGANFRNGAWVAQTMTAATRNNGCLKIASARNWCPTDRTHTGADTQYFGIWIKIRREHTMPFTGPHTDIERTAVMRLEPPVEGL